MLLRILLQLRRHSVARREPIDVAITKEDDRLFRLAKPRRRLGKSIQHRLEVELGAADDLEHISRRCLLLQGLSQLSQQPSVFDCNDGLACEIRDERDLLIRERPERKSFASLLFL